MEQGKHRVIVKVYDGLDLVFKKEYDNKSCEGALMRLELDAGIKANFKKISYFFSQMLNIFIHHTLYMIFLVNVIIRINQRGIYRFMKIK